MHIRRGPIVGLLLSLSVLAAQRGSGCGSGPRRRRSQRPIRSLHLHQPPPPTEAQDAATSASAIDAAVAGQQTRFRIRADLGVAPLHPEPGRFGVCSVHGRHGSQSAEQRVRCTRRPRGEQVGRSSASCGTSRTAPPTAAAAAARHVPWDRIMPSMCPPTGRCRVRLRCLPGTYDVFVAIKEKSTAPASGPPKIGVAQHELTVPSFCRT